MLMNLYYGEKLTRSYYAYRIFIIHPTHYQRKIKNSKLYYKIRILHFKYFKRNL